MDQPTGGDFLPRRRPKGLWLLSPALALPSGQADVGVRPYEQETLHADHRLRTAFNRDIGNKVLFIKSDKLLFFKGVKLKAIADRSAYFTALRARQCQPIVILTELPPDEAFALWKRYALSNDLS